MKEISPKKRFGQNFINDEVLLGDLVDLIKVKKNDDFLEIGPGSGNLTSLIVSSANSCSSVEIDRDLISLLKEKFKKNDNFKIINENILNFDLKKYVSNFNQIRLAGNLPYNLSSPIIDWCTKNIDLIKDMHFMFQKEFAYRCAGNENSKSYGKLSVICNYLFEVEILKEVDRSFFVPAPKVDSCFVKFVPRKKNVNFEELNFLKKILNLLFNSKRKKISKPLLKIFEAKDLENLNIDLDLRPDQLSLEKFLELTKLMKKYG